MTPLGCRERMCVQPNDPYKIYKPHSLLLIMDPLNVAVAYFVFSRWRQCSANSQTLGYFVWKQKKGVNNVAVMMAFHSQIPKFAKPLLPSVLSTINLAKWAWRPADDGDVNVFLFDDSSRTDANAAPCIIVFSLQRCEKYRILWFFKKKGKISIS